MVRNDPLNLNYKYTLFSDHYKKLIQKIIDFVKLKI